VKVWRKFFPDAGASGTEYRKRDSSVHDHRREMGGYREDDGYSSVEAFFRTHFHGASWGRFEAYDRFVRRFVEKSRPILSVASGRAANELALLRDGYRVVCSDLERPPCYEATKRLFPTLDYRELDVFQDPWPWRADALLVLSLIHLFDEAALERFLRSAARALPEGGVLILDAAGAPDNAATFVWHNIVLPAEAWAKYVIARYLLRRPVGLVVKRFGFVRTDREILDAGARAGFRLAERWTGGFLFEFRRSSTVGRWIGRARWIDAGLSWLGRVFPYLRLFCFVKESTGATAGPGEGSKEET
jgi:SAM-dependent methyltransferase